MRALFAEVLVGALLQVACANNGKLPMAATGGLGQALGEHGQTLPRGAEACALEEGLKAPVGSPTKPMAESCKADLASDQLWSTALMVLGAYADGIAAMAEGAEPEHAGRLAAELTLVRDENFVEVEDEDEIKARQAVNDLVKQMVERGEKADLESTLKEATPHVQTLCDGLLAYLDEQEGRFLELQKGIENKFQGPGTQRCTKVSGQTVCVSNSTLDRLTHAELVGHTGQLALEHRGARNAVAAFCVAHYTVAQAAENGELKKEETYDSVVEAVHAAIPVPPAGPSQTAGSDAR